MVLFIDLWCCMHVELNSSFDYADWVFKFFFLEISLLPFLNMFGWINNRWHLGSFNSIGFLFLWFIMQSVLTFWSFLYIGGFFFVSGFCLLLDMNQILLCLQEESRRMPQKRLETGKLSEKSEILWMILFQQGKGHSIHRFLAPLQGYTSDSLLSKLFKAQMHRKHLLKLLNSCLLGAFVHNYRKMGEHRNPLQKLFLFMDLPLEKLERSRNLRLWWPLAQMKMIRVNLQHKGP